MLSDADISSGLAPFGISADETLCERIRTYISLLLRWNERVSLTTVTDPREIIKFHFGESLFAAISVPIQFGRLADVGSGAGFPGIPLAMYARELQATLIESNLKKSTFLSEVARSLSLQNVTVVRSRMEDFPAESIRFDFVTVRAVGSFPELLSWAQLALSDFGILVLWLGGSDVTEVSSDSSWKWREPIRIPGSRNRYLLIGSPLRSK